jgi:DNA-binding response OmpR family regulator
MMPRMNGIALCEFVRQERPGVKVLFITGGSKPEFSLLRKPFTHEELLEKVREVLANPSIGRAVAG